MLNRNKLLDKIRALLSKTITNGCTENEAMAALDKAQVMIDAYEVTTEELQLSRAQAAIIKENPWNQDPHGIKWELVSGVEKFCDCTGWRSSKKFVFAGSPADVEFAHWLLDSLANFVRNELHLHLMESSFPPGQRRLVIKSFVLGCCVRIRMRLKELKSRSEQIQASNSRELVLVKSAAIDEALKAAGVEFRTINRRVKTIDPKSYEAGKEAGDKASFGRPVTGRAQERLR